jgi:hypothetical protein
LPIVDGRTVAERQSDGPIALNVSQRRFDLESDGLQSILDPSPYAVG